MDRAIIHLNVADFAVAVERAMDRRLCGRPVVIAPEGAERAAVYDMSEEAFQAGVRKGMALARAARRCRDACVLPPHPERYEQAMRALLQRALPFSPRIEAGENDGHLFIDATGTGRLLGPPMDVAWRLRREIRTHLGFAPIWSVAPNKLVAKVATRLVKPEGEYIVAAGEEQPFLAPPAPGTDPGHRT
jgi:DNA polymerase-4